jgi:hypothetical protein
MPEVLREFLTNALAIGVILVVILATIAIAPKKIRPIMVVVPVCLVAIFLHRRRHRH